MRINYQKVKGIGCMPGTNANDWENQFSNGFMSIDYDFPDDLTSFKTKEDLDEASEEYGIEEGSMTLCVLYGTFQMK